MTESQHLAKLCPVEGRAWDGAPMGTDAEHWYCPACASEIVPGQGGIGEIYVFAHYGQRSAKDGGLCLVCGGYVSRVEV